MRRIFLTGGMALLLSGCAATGVEVKQRQALEFKAGQSTYADVVKTLGVPISYIALRDGTREIIYSYDKATVHVERITPIVGRFAGGADTNATIVIFDFDRNGVVTQFGSSAGAIGAGMEAGNQKSERHRLKR